MKKFKKICSVVLAACSVAALVGCNNGSGSDNSGGDASGKKIINLDYWKSGFGLDYLNKIIAEFEKTYPEYKISLTYSSYSGVYANTITKNAETNGIDLYMSNALTSDFNSYLEPLDDVLSSKYKDETKTIAEKYNQTFLGGLKAADGHYYNLSYGGGYVGIFYNTSKFRKYGLSVPNTTEQLVDVVEKIDAKGDKAWISFGSNAGYWTYNDEVWQAQYDGLDYFYNTYLTLMGEDGTAPDKAVYERRDGRYYVLQTQYKLQNNSYIDPHAFTDKFAAAQTRFVAGTGVMMANGTWIQNEMKQKGASGIDLMKTPVISYIRQNLPDSSVENDRELSAVITAIDKADESGKTKTDILSGNCDFITVTENEVSGTVADSYSKEQVSFSVTKNDFERLYEARHISFSTHNESVFAIPNYADQKDGAKEFIKFFYSDDMITLYENELHFPQVVYNTKNPVKSTNGWSDMEKKMIDLMETSNPVFRVKINQSQMFSTGGLTSYGQSNYKFRFAAPNVNDRRDAETIWNEIQTLANENWDKYKQNAGIL